MTLQPQKSGPVNKGPRVNEQITSPSVRLVDEHGNMVGVVSRSEALKQAQNVSLDLVEISPHTDPPVCKIQDYGKFKYEEQKRRAEIKRKQKVIEIKEIQIRPSIEDHDYQVKLRSIHRFLEEGNKVKVTLQFRGREMNHQELGVKVLNRLQSDLELIGKVESSPKLEGKRLMMILGPK